MSSEKCTAQDYGLPRESSYLTYGWDSEVFRLNDIVFKAYYGVWSLSHILTYQSMHSVASSRIGDIPRLNTDDYEIQVAEIVPIDRVWKQVNETHDPRLPDAWCLTESRFIPGSSGKDLNKPDRFFKANSALEEDEQQRLHELQVQWGRQDKQLSSRVIGYLNGCSQWLNLNLQVRGISIIPGNVKFRMPQDNRIDIFITDIASDLFDLLG